ncbi:MAG TPA: hypothetical protein VFN35_15110 [Ktedonobacteraceae bacterium]|nr:hypothetical protein [Ktedonobacteraceae bacterium]
MVFPGSGSLQVTACGAVKDAVKRLSVFALPIGVTNALMRQNVAELTNA